MFLRTKKQILLTSLAAIGFAAVAAHIYLDSPEDAKGVLAVLDHVFDVTLALALTVTSVSVGYAVCEGFRFKFANAAEAIGVSLFVGTGVIGLTVLFLGLASLLRPIPIAAMLAVCIVFSRRSWMRLYPRIKATIQSLTSTREAAVVTTIYFSLIVFLTLRAAVPPTAADEVIYHLPVTSDFVQHGAVHPMFDNSLGNLPFLIHMIYTICLLAGSDIAARVISLFLAVGTSFAIFGFCARYLSTQVAAVAAFAFFAAGMVVEVAVTSRIDVSLAGMLFTCTYAMVNYLDTGHRGWLWVSAALAGFSLGIKHTAVLWLTLVGFMYLIQRLIMNRDRILPVLGAGVLYSLIAFSIASPWYIKNYVWFHNPVYPLLTGEVAEFGPNGIRYFDANDERRLDAHFDVARAEMPDVVAAQEKELTDAVNSRVQRHPLRWWEYFVKPSNYLMSEPFHYPNYLFLVITFLVFMKRPKWISWLLILSLGFIFAVTWTSWIARYLLPAYPALTIVVSYTLIELSERLKSRRASMERLPLYAVACALAVVIAAGVKTMTTFNSVSFLTGHTSRRETVSRFTYYEPIRFINSLPSNARILVIGAQLTYGIEREHLTDEGWFATKWRRVLVHNASYEGINEDLKKQHFTHIFYSDGIFKFAAIMGTQGTGGTDMMSVNQKELSPEARRLGPEYQLLRNWSTFTLYKSKFLETLYSRDGYEILRIK
jgi:4-amino-4-deoxy-L-arabinose transferase-like glycosyltransferase